MTQRNWYWEAKQLLPHLTDLLAGGVTVQAGGGGLVAHALDSTTWHVGTLAESQAPWAVTEAEFAAHTGNANAHHAQLHSLADPTHHSGQLPWAWLNKVGSDLAHLETRSHDSLQDVTADQHHDKLHNVVDTNHHSIGGSTWDVVGKTAAGALGLITPQDSVTSVQTALLKATNGRTTLYEYYATGRMRTPLVDTASGSLTLSPAGTAVLPTGSIQKDLGDYNRKWRSLYAAELYVETLVAQDVLATIGGRIMVAPTTKTISDTNSSQTTIEVEHNNITGAYIYMATAPGGMAQVEVMRVTAGPTVIAGGYRYTVQRNIDGSGANGWVAGSAVANIGATAGQGWIDLTSTNTVYNHLGPTMTIYSRTGMTAWTDAKPVVSIGNLRSWVDYGADEFGFALGNDLTLLPQSGFSGMTGDRVQGLRMFNTQIEMYSSTVNTGKWYINGSLVLATLGVDDVPNRDFVFDAASGVLRVGKTGENKPNLYWNGSSLRLRMNETTVIELASDGKSYFQREMWLGSEGGIYQGNGTFSSPLTGLKLWNDSGVGRLAGYDGGVLQAGFNSSGQITAGGGNLILDANGLSLRADHADPESNRSIVFRNSAGIEFASLSASAETGGDNTLDLYCEALSGSFPIIFIGSAYSASYPGAVILDSGGAASLMLAQSGGVIRATGTVFELGTPIDTTSGTHLELKREGASILRSVVNTAGSYLRLGLGRSSDGDAYFDLIGDTTYSAYGLRFIRNAGENGGSILTQRGTGALQFRNVEAADMIFQTNNATRVTITGAGLAKFASSVAVGGDYGGTAGYMTLTNQISGKSTGTGTVKLAGTSSRDSDGFVKIYLGTAAVWIPYWANIT